MTKVISVISGKGGVGKTTLVSNLGAALVNLEKNVIVIDGNVTSANLGIHLGMPAVNPVSLNDVLKEDAFITQAMYRYKEGFTVIPASIGEIEANYGGLKNQISRLLGNSDIILIDAAAGVSEEVEAAIDASDEVILVTNPEYTAVLGAISAKKLALKKNKKILGTIINKRMSEKHEMSAKEVELFLELPVLATIRNHRKVREAIAYRTPVVVHSPHASVSKQIRNIAYKLLEQEPPKESVVDKIKTFLQKDIRLSFE
ncbi:MAG: AAA family ATPase [archaeon]